MEIPKLITILGPTASGKTHLAAHLALKINGEIISADSRQVYIGMTIGTGKDLDDYCIDGQEIPYHLIDILSPMELYNVFRFKTEFITKSEQIIKKGKQAILCGGTGLYLDSVLLDYNFHSVPENISLRKKLEKRTIQELSDMLQSMKHIHIESDLSSKERLLRAIEISEFQKNKKHQREEIHISKSLVFGIQLPRDVVRKRISERLQKRLDEGMIDEVEALLNNGVTYNRLVSFGLEYRFVSQYIFGELSFDEMKSKLETAIHQFSKRQMTWFRRMERLGIHIHWIDGLMDENIKLNTILEKVID